MFQTFDFRCVTIISFQGGARSHTFDLGWKIGKYAAKSGGLGGGGGHSTTGSHWAQILIGGRTNTEPSLPRTACQRTFQGVGEGACLLTLARVLKERWGRGGGVGGGLVSHTCFSCEAFTL